MTRNELIDGLKGWKPGNGQRPWSSVRFRRRDNLAFALWWYGASTESDKANPTWPDADYVRANLTGCPRYLTEVDAALSLIPSDLYWIIGKGKTKPREPLFGVQVMRPDNPDDAIAEAEGDSLPIAICIAAIKARMVSP